LLLYCLSVNMGIKDMMHTQVGSILISIILGVGLACIFRKACKDNQCIVIKGPNIQEVQNRIYKIKDKCYSYETEFADCQES